MSGLSTQERSRLAAALGSLSRHMAAHRPANVGSSDFWRPGKTDHQKLARILLQTGHDWPRGDRLFLRSAANDSLPSRESQEWIAALHESAPLNKGGGCDG